MPVPVPVPVLVSCSCQYNGWLSELSPVGCPGLAVHASPHLLVVFWPACCLLSSHLTPPKNHSHSLTHTHTHSLARSHTGEELLYGGQEAVCHHQRRSQHRYQPAGRQAVRRAFWGGLFVWRGPGRREDRTGQQRVRCWLSVRLVRLLNVAC